MLCVLVLLQRGQWADCPSKARYHYWRPEKRIRILIPFDVFMILSCKKSIKPVAPLIITDQGPVIMLKRNINLRIRKSPFLGGTVKRFKRIE